MRRSSLAQENDSTFQLAHLRELTRRFGILHEFQVLQLKLWPRVAIPHSRTSRAEVDVKGCRVALHVTTKGRAPKDFQGRLRGLGESVQTLLGDEWTVDVYENERPIYALSRARPAPERREYAGTDFEAGKLVPEQSWQFPKSKPSKK